MVAELDDGIRPIKQRARGLTGGHLLMGMAAAQLVGQDCLAGGWTGSEATTAAPC